jgi:hypothetical protein
MRILASVAALAAVVWLFTFPATAQDADKLIMRLRPVCNNGQGSTLVIAFDVKARVNSGSGRVGGYCMTLTYNSSKLVYQGSQQRYSTSYWSGQPWYIDTPFGAAAHFNQHGTQPGNSGGAMPLTSQYWQTALDCAGNPLGDGFFEVLRYTFDIGPSANGTVNFSMFDYLPYKSGIVFQHGTQCSAMYYSNLNNNSNDSMIVINNLIIPVELSMLHATMQDNRTVELTWRTESESSNQGFEIERGDGTTFERIGFVPGNGSSSERHDYSYIDQNPVSRDGRPLVFYRLRQVDADGTGNYSHIVSAAFAPETIGLEANFPNPMEVGASTSIPYTLAVPGTVTLGVYNALGQQVATLVDGVSRFAGRYTATWDGMRSDGGAASAGVYFLRYSADLGGGEVYTATRQFSITR